MSIIDNVFEGLQDKFLNAYLNDILIYSNTFEEHLHHIREPLTRLRCANLKLKPSKCIFATKQVDFLLGHTLTNHGLKPNKGKVSAIADMQRPYSLKATRRFLRSIGFYRKFVKDFSILAEPLFRLTRKEVPFIWTKDCQEAFEKLKTSLSSSPILKFPDWNQEFILACEQHCFRKTKRIM